MIKLKSLVNKASLEIEEHTWLPIRSLMAFAIIEERLIGLIGAMEGIKYQPFDANFDSLNQIQGALTCSMLGTFLNDNIDDMFDCAETDEIYVVMGDWICDGVKFDPRERYSNQELNDFPSTAYGSVVDKDGNIITYSSHVTKEQIRVFSEFLRECEGYKMIKPC